MQTPLEMTPGTWEHFQHDADIGVRGLGSSREEAFAKAAAAVAALFTDPLQVKPREVLAIHCEAPDDRILLADFLNAVIFEATAHHRVFARFEVRIENHRLEARAFGEPFDPARHEPGVDVKGATFTELEVSRSPSGGWVAQCVVDV